jgi:hypothetical protein
MNEGRTGSGIRQAPAKQVPLVCRLQPKEVSARQGLIPNMGEVELENCSTGSLEIEYTMTPLQFFELEVLGPDGKVISEGHFSDRFSPTREPAVLHLLPGDKFSANVSLLATVPREKRRPGVYTVRASYHLEGIPILAEPVTFELPGSA